MIYSTGTENGLKHNSTRDPNDLYAATGRPEEHPAT